MLRQNSGNRFTAGFLDVNEQHLAAIDKSIPTIPLTLKARFVPDDT